MAVTQAFDFLIQWHLTERCNLKCKHCYQSRAKVQELSCSEICRVIDTAVQMLNDWREDYDIEFATSFNVTGGEPFLRSDFFIILEKMVATGFEIFILSNGTLVTPETARKVADLGVKGVQVSMEGPEEVHRLIRGEGSFPAAVAGIQALVQAGVRVNLNTTLSQFTAPHFLELAGLAASWGVPRLGCARLVPFGQGLEMLDQMLSSAELKQFYEKVFTPLTDGLQISSGDPMASQMTTTAPAPEEDTIPLGGCAAGVSGLTILADGTITPCRRLPIPIGNVRQDSLREVWATSRVLEALRDKARYGGKCGRCSRWSQCRGCRGVAYAYSQAQGSPDFLAADPQCFIPDVQ